MGFDCINIVFEGWTLYLTVLVPDHHISFHFFLLFQGMNLLL